MATKPTNHESEYEDPLDEDLDSTDEQDDESGSEDDIGTSTVTEEVDEGQKVDSEGTEVDEDEKEREAIRARRREERRHKKEAAREREAYLRAELAARDETLVRIQARLNELEQKTVGGEAAQIQRVKQDAAQAYTYWKDQIRIGTENQNGALVAEATEKMLQAQTRFGQATQYEEALVQRAKQRQQAPITSAQPDPRLVYHAERWISEHPWYKQGGTDPDSKRVAAIDSALEREGFDPNTPEYWDELTARVQQHLPHRANGASIQTEGGRSSASGSRNGQRPRSVVSGSGKGNLGGQHNSAKTLSPERVSALKDAGLWDDPAKRDLAIKEFQRYDKEHQRG